jgi:Cu(I)/Ag(I) efflux system membrane fusion protein
MRGDDWVQVLDGIKAGDNVVVGANFLIDAESNLRSVLQGLAEGSKPATGGPEGKP